VEQEGEMPCVVVTPEMVTDWIQVSWWSRGTQQDAITTPNHLHGRRLAMGAGGEHKREKEGTSHMRGNESRLGGGGVVVTGRSASAASKLGKNAQACRRSLCVNARARQGHYAPPHSQ
jgi:hypothetical protein